MSNSREKRPSILYRQTHVPSPLLIPKTLPGITFVISAPAGTGKTSLVHTLVSRFPSLALCITYTTRAPRREEQDGIDYFFISCDEFYRKIQKGDFLEYVELHGNVYGSSKSHLQQLQVSGTHPILIIDTQGAEKIRSQLSDAVYIFIQPPSLDVLRDRMIARKSESDESLAKRLIVAQYELQQAYWYDYCVLNDDFTLAADTLTSIIVAEVQRHIHRLQREKR